LIAKAKIDKAKMKVEDEISDEDGNKADDANPRL
jgi:hypothetical protein